MSPNLTSSINISTVWLLSVCVCTSEESLSEGFDGVGIGQVQLPNLHLSPAHPPADLRRRFFSFLDVATGQDHPRTCRKTQTHAAFSK